jgi:hypothetical protein
MYIIKLDEIFYVRARNEHNLLLGIYIRYLPDVCAAMILFCNNLIGADAVLLE